MKQTDDKKFYHSVYLQPDLCVGCIHCLKRCPTQAIRVPRGKAQIIKEFCIDCSECITHCPHNAKKSRRAHLEYLTDYKYKVALVDPSMYGQFNRLNDVNIMLTALLSLGFDDVFEVGYAYEYLLEKTDKFLNSSLAQLPAISATCPSVVRLIRVRFPELLDNLVPFLPPTEIAAQAALKEAQDKTGLSREEIGIIYIAPCPAQVSFASSPLGMEESYITDCLAMKDIYTAMLPLMKEARKNPKPLSRCSQVGIRVAITCRESLSLETENWLAADGIENVIRVLSDIEDDKIPDHVRYIELKGCSGGCVGGVLNIDNPYMARSKILRLSAEKTPSTLPFFEEKCRIDLRNTLPIEYEPVYTLGETMLESMTKMQEVEALQKQLPGLDCGSCGAPTCLALAEDTVRGTNHAGKDKCIYLMRGRYYRMKQALVEASEKKESQPAGKIGKVTIKKSESSSVAGGTISKKEETKSRKELHMTIKDLTELDAFETVVASTEPEREISVPYCCDLLSAAMRNAPADGVWCTVMNNVNTLAVASLTDVACIVLCDGTPVNPDVKAKAEEQEICLLSTSLSIFEAALEVYKRTHES